jgi:hypothetical protein
MPIKLSKREQHNADIRKQALNDAKAVALLARECLTDKKFKKYRKKALEHQEKLIDAIIDYVNPNPVEYAFEVREMLSVLGYSKLFLKDVEKEAKVEEGK